MLMAVPIGIDRNPLKRLSAFHYSDLSAFHYSDLPELVDGPATKPAYRPSIGDALAFDVVS